MAIPPFLKSGPFRLGFIATLGVLLALVLGGAVSSLSYSFTLIFFAFFIALGLYPLVRRLERLRLSRPAAVAIVAALFVIVVGLFLLLIVPVASDELHNLLKYIPGGLDQIEHQQWFLDLNATLDHQLTPFVEDLQKRAADPAVWIAVGGGALRVTANILSGAFGVLFVVILTLYFVAAMESIKQGLYSLAPASRRAGVTEISEEIAESVGKYLSGMFIVAAINAVFTFILLSIMGVKYAAVLAALALPITLIPLVGPLISTALVTFVSLFTSPLTGLIVLIVMIVFMQVEAYFITPRIVGKAINIPGYLVLIGAMIGGTLLGLLGVLIACPFIASVLLITKKVVVPAQNEI
jgi:predicted PurR-regulated permease PerM